jgi:hypothetical protein
VKYLRRHWVELGCLVLGLGLLGATLWQIGVETLIQDLGVLGWGLVVVLLVETLNLLFNTCGWALAFPAGERTVGGLRLLAVRLAGDAVNYLTPSGTVGGEFLRIRLLDGAVPVGVRWASVGVAKLAQAVAQVVFVLLGLALVLPHLTHVNHGVAWLAGGGAALLVSLGLARLLRRGLWVTVEGLGRALGLGRWVPAGWAGPGRELDAAVARLGHRRLGGSLACYVVAWAVGAVEIYVILAWLGGPAGWATALAVEIGSVVIDGILFFVPAKVGTQEGGKVLLFAALGLSPARGLTVGVVRRIRELVYAGLGLAALGVLTVRGRPRLPSALAHRSELP